MADIDIMNDDLSLLLRNRDYQKALEMLREWESKDEFDPETLSGELLLAISRTYYFGKRYEKSREYLYVFENNYPQMCLDIEYIEQKDKLLILEDKADQVIKLLFTAINKNKNENEKYWLILYLGKAYFWNGEYREANRHFRKCHTYYLEAGDDHMLGLTLYMMGYLAFQRNMLDQAESYFEEALSSFKKVKRAKQMGNCYNLLGIIKYRTGNYEESKKYLDLARSKYQFCSSINNVLNCRIAGARVEMFRGDYDLSEGILKETYREAGGLNYRRAQALSAEFLGEICCRRERYGEAEQWLTEALELAERTAPRGDVAAEVFRRLGDVQIELGKLTEAEATLSEAEKLCNHLDDKYELGSVFRARAVLAIRRGDPETARSWIDESVILHRTINERFELGCTYMK
ncbi:MAG: tetratricopeptide repeat protein, partial [Candidatus Latescibacteria bacterium]|nr:tetratricopeptide repeat protein [Candidatus Latescibacterota bacterium]